jgi:radical SAM protein with 4Fe4S-binding SPASM domain
MIARFCRERTKDYFRFDPFLHLRYDRDPTRNAEIKAERLSPGEIVALEKADPERLQTLKKGCDGLIAPRSFHTSDNCLFHCGAGSESFSLGYDGLFHLCSSLCHPDCVYNLRQGTLTDAWQNFSLKVRAMQSERNEFLKTCHGCPLINLCMWCPAHASLETGELDAPVTYFCQVAHARAEALKTARGLQRPMEI